MILILILQFLPFIFILWLANLADKRRQEGERHQGLQWLVFALVGLLFLGALFLGLILQAAGALLQAQGTVDAVPGLSPDVVQSLGRVAPGLWLPALVAIVLLLAPVRRLLAHLLPMDPASMVHAVALTYSMLIVAQLWVTLGMGLGNLASLLEQGTGMGSELLVMYWVQDLLWVLMGAIGVGWLTRRPLAGVVERLGIAMPTWRQWLLGPGLGLILALLVTGLLTVTERLGLGVGEDVEKLGELLIGPLTQSVWGILTLGLAAALGEETLCRGALQPRFGLLLTAIIFTLLHAQYGLSMATGVVLVVGLILGLLRRYANTTTSMLFHATYNMTLGLLALWGR